MARNVRNNGGAQPAQPKYIPNNNLRMALRFLRIGPKEFITQLTAFRERYDQGEVKSVHVEMWLDNKREIQGDTFGLLSAFFAEKGLTIVNWRDTRADNKMMTTAMVFPVVHNLAAWTERERRELPSSYQCYRYAFRNNDRICWEHLRIEHKGDPLYMDVTIRSPGPSDAADDDKIPFIKCSKPEIFKGRLYKIGVSYFGLLTYHDSDIATCPFRLRHLELTAIPATDEVEHWWALVGGLGGNTYPSCASTVACKRRATDGADPKEPEIGFGWIEAVPQQYQAAISNDTKQYPAEPRSKGRDGKERHDAVLRAGNIALEVAKARKRAQD